MEDAWEDNFFGESKEWNKLTEADMAKWLAYRDVGLDKRYAKQWAKSIATSMEDPVWNAFLRQPTGARFNVESSYCKPQLAKTVGTEVLDLWPTVFWQGDSRPSSLDTAVKYRKVADDHGGCGEAENRENRRNWGVW